MGKISKKLIVYLDQNFISEMAKADLKSTVNPQFTEIYKLLHKGFTEEQLVVPSSFFHDLETCFIPNLKERITQYQAYLGQVRMEHAHTIQTFQMVRAAKEFLDEHVEPVDYHIAFHQDPDNVTEQFKIEVDLHLERWNTLSDRVVTAEALQKVKNDIQQNKLTVEQQYELEIDAARESFIKKAVYRVGWVFGGDQKKIEEFARSGFFKKIPSIDIGSKMWAKILVDYNNRPIGTGDQTDIEIISTVLPYVDVFAGDSFMINIIRQLGLNKIYQTEVFGATKDELKKFEDTTIKYLKGAEPINRPILSIFVLPDKKIRESEKCFQFFKDLGLQFVGKKNMDKYVEMYVFNDGGMPKYKHKELGMEIPFTGLQDFDHIKIQKGISMKEIIEKCREECRSEKFIIIDRYQKFENTFLSHVLELIEKGKEEVYGCKVYSKNKTP